MEFLKNILEKLSTPYSERVGVYISADSKMEVVVYDKNLVQVKNSEKASVKYDNVIRQVNLEDFETVLVSLVTKLGIPASCPFFVCLPNVLTSIKTLPSELEDIELEVALGSEAEKSYVFKKSEPKVSWNLLSTNEQNFTSAYIYSIIQKEQVDAIQQIFDRNNLKLFAVDSSFACLVRGLSASGMLNESIERNAKWVLVTVSFNNYLIAKFEGRTLVNIIETPFALKSIDPEKLYPTINAAIAEKLGQESIDNLYIISQTSDFIAENLVEYIQLICDIYAIDNNKYKDNALFLSQINPVADPISLESVGAASWNNAEVNVSFNFSDKDASNEIQGVLGKIGVKKTIHLYLFIAIIGAIILIAINALLYTGINKFLKAQIVRQSVAVENLKKLDTQTPKVFDQENFIKQTYTKNLDVLNSYDALGATIPEKAWLKTIFLNHELKTVIIGGGYNIEDIIMYYENLQKTAKFKNLKIKTVKVFSPEANVNTTTPQAGGIPLPLPPLPLPGQNLPQLPQIAQPQLIPEEVEVFAEKHYEFVFEDTGDKSGGKDSYLDILPEPVKKLVGN